LKECVVWDFKKIEKGVKEEKEYPISTVKMLEYISSSKRSTTQSKI
jgi:hypothetical protein